MTISSRTPEGDPNQCPICGHHVRIEPSIDTRDAPCPRCGHLLWFSDDWASRNPGLADKWVAKEEALEVAARRLGPPPPTVRAMLENVGPTKFDKVRWNQLVRAKSWEEVVTFMTGQNR